jgi:ribosomal protein L37AE/L43A
MGVDAQILLKITNPASWVDPVQLRQLSARLTNVIGHEQFFLRPEENRHALSFTIDENAKYPDEYEEIHGKPFDRSAPAIYSQDGDDIVAKPNEQFIELHIFGRYYHEDYARGDWKTLSWIMLWCVYNIPDCEVWYGGDSSGCVAELMTPERMNKMTKYYLTRGNDDYWMNEKTLYRCDFCGCGVVQNGGSNTVGFWTCNSCGSQWVTSSNPRNGSASKFGGSRVAVPELVTKYDPSGEDHDLGDGFASFGISEQITKGTRKMYPFDGVFHSKYPYVAPVQIDAATKQLGAAAKQLS